MKRIRCIYLCVSAADFVCYESVRGEAGGAPSYGNFAQNALFPARSVNSLKTLPKMDNSPFGLRHDPFWLATRIAAAGETVQPELMSP